MNKKDIAKKIIETAFANKTDKAGKPYIGHLERVAENSKLFYNPNYTGNFNPAYDNLEAVALLHDLLEDCPSWKSEHLESLFGSFVTEAVNVLTRKSNVSYEDYISGIAGNSLAIAVKLADLKDNMDLSRLSEISDKDIERIKKYHKSFVFLKKSIKK